jgi:hypothetical protein
LALAERAARPCACTLPPAPLAHRSQASTPTPLTQSYPPAPPPRSYCGEHIGDGSPPAVDIAVDPLDGTTLTAQGRSGAISVIALAEVCGGGERSGGGGREERGLS